MCYSMLCVWRWHAIMMAEISPEYLESLAKFYSNSSFFPFLLLDKTWLYLINWIHANMISKKKLSMESHLRWGSDWYCPSIVHLLLSFLLYFIYNNTTATATTTTSRCATYTTTITATTYTTTMREIGVRSPVGTDLRP